MRRYYIIVTFALLTFLHPVIAQGKGVVNLQSVSGKPIQVVKQDNPSTSFISDIQTLQQQIIQKQHDAQVAAQKAQETTEAAAQAPPPVPVAPAPTPQPVAPVQSGDYYLNWIIQRESGGNPYAINPSTGACGLFQKLPCNVPLGDVAAQTADGLAYINSRYGSAYNAYLHEVNFGWY